MIVELAAPMGERSHPTVGTSSRPKAPMYRRSLTAVPLVGP